MHIPFCLPKDISPKEFLANYWQQKPLLIKNGLPQLINMFEPQDILDLALEEEVASRLITQTPKHDIKQPKLESHFNWRLKNSPLTEDDFDQLPKLWTTLVQNLEQWSPELANLWQAFDFIPQWQRDDIMVSYAPTGGSVGKHYDDYDVFLAQGYGSRRWQLGKYCDENTEFVANQPIRIFDDMGTIIFDEVLEPGDVLYVPPKLSHFGVAQNDCLTFSFGFRRPNMMQVFDSLADIATSEPSCFVPMMLEQALHTPGALTKQSINAIKSQLIKLLNSPTGDDLLTQAIAESVSKRQYDILLPEEVLTADEVMSQLVNGACLKPDYNSRLIYTINNNITRIYANGQLLTNLCEQQISLLQKLANGGSLDYQQLNEIDTQTIMEWLENGWVWLDC